MHYINILFLNLYLPKALQYKGMITSNEIVSHLKLAIMISIRQPKLKKRYANFTLIY